MMIAKQNKLFLILLFSQFLSFKAFAIDSLSYSGRLVNNNGSPVPGPVTIRAELAYTNAPGTILCTEDIPGVTLTKGVFHIKLTFDCSVAGIPLTQVLAQTPAGKSVAIRITDVRVLPEISKVYSFQALHSIPFANLAEQLVQMGATPGNVLAWDGTKWAPAAAGGGGGGTVTSVSGTLPISVGTGTSTPAISISQANTSTSGYLSSTDWDTFNNKQGSIAAGTTAQYYRGDKSWQTLGTGAVPEGTNLYFTNARVLGVPLTTFSTATGAIVGTDNILQAFGKAQGQIDALTTAGANYLIKNGADTLSGTVSLTNVITATGTGDIIVNSVPLMLTSAVNKTYVDTADGLKVTKTGDVMSGVLTLDSDLKIKGGSNYVTLKGHSASAAYNLFLPGTAGTPGYVLSTDGSGNTSWINPASVAQGSGTVDSASIIDGTIVDADVNASAAIAQSKIANLVTDLAAKQTTTLSNGNILVGSVGNVATAVAVSGDATIISTGAVTLKNTGTAGTYTSVTTDAQGRVTVGTNPTVVTSISVTAPLTNTGTANVPLIGMPAAATSVDGYLTLTNWNTFNNKQSAITSTSTINTGSITTNFQGGVVINPYGAAAENTGEIHFNELAANGTNYVALKAPDALAANVIYTLPAADGTAGQVLTTNAAGSLSWTSVATGGTNLVGDIGGTIGANTIGAGKVTLTHLSATGATNSTTYLRGDNTWATFANDVLATALTGLPTATNAVITASDTVLLAFGKLQKQISALAISTVGGDLSGTLPNPTVAKIQGIAVSSSGPISGQFFNFNGTNWAGKNIVTTDLKSSVSGNLFPGTGCSVNQTLGYSVGTDAFSCVNIDSLDGAKITTGTIAAARLPPSAGYWTAATGGVNYAGGNVGIGATNPLSTLDVRGTFSSSVANSVSTSGSGSILSTLGGGGFPGNVILQGGNGPTGGNYTGQVGSKITLYGGDYNSYGGGNGGNIIMAMGADPYATSNLSINDSAGNSRMSVLSTGNVGIGNTSPSKLLHVGSSSVGSGVAVASFQNVDGTCTITPAAAGSGIACSSDERLKENFLDVQGTYALERILKLQAVTFNFKTASTEIRRTGYKAQEVKKIAPEFVRQNDDGYFQVYYDGFIPWITEAIKILHSRISGLDAVQAVHGRDIAIVKAFKADKSETDVLKAENGKLKQENIEIKVRLDRIEKLLNR